MNQKSDNTFFWLVTIQFLILLWCGQLLDFCSGQLPVANFTRSFCQQNFYIYGFLRPCPLPLYNFNTSSHIAINVWVDRVIFPKSISIDLFSGSSRREELATSQCWGPHHWCSDSQNSSTWGICLWDSGVQPSVIWSLVFTHHYGITKSFKTQQEFCCFSPHSLLMTLQMEDVLKSMFVYLTIYLLIMISLATNICHRWQ